ncbi:MAG: hypothetical protein K2O18_03705, partial [Oscillospiraceae bacterium]|nr:hypothetical protein [Oscillospiraceae bacterium]
MKKRDLRGSLAAKCAAIFLLLFCAGLTLLSAGVVIAQSYGYGVYSSFAEDPLLLEEMHHAMYYALNQALEPSGSRANTLHERYNGFSAQIFDGDPIDGVSIGIWSEIPENTPYQTSFVEDSPEAESGYYTIIGYLRDDIPAGGIFQRNYSLYRFIHSFHYASTMILGIVSLLVSFAALGFLLCAAGHRKGREGIFPNWQDRIPLDLYLCCVFLLITFTLILCDQAMYNRYVPLLVYSQPRIMLFFITGGLG